MLTLYTLGVVLISLLALYRYAQYGWNPVTVKGIFLPFFKDHTIFGATVALLSGYWLFIPVHKTRLDRLLVHRAIGFWMVGAVFLSYSRAAIISLLVMVVSYLLLKVKIRGWQLASVFGIILLVVLLNAQFFSSLLVQNRFDSGDKDSDLVEHTLSSGNINTDVSNRERLNRWDAGLQMFAKKPLTGYGPGTYQFAYIPFQRQKMMTRLSVKDPYHIPENSGGTAHSEYILAASEMGILGILGWMTMIIGITAVIFLLPVYHSSRKNAIATVAALSTYFFHGVFNNFLNTDKFAFLFWGLIAWFCFMVTRKTS